MAIDELYIDFFGFSERPFTLLPDPDFLFLVEAPPARVLGSRVRNAHPRPDQR